MCLRELLYSMIYSKNTMELSVGYLVWKLLQRFGLVWFIEGLLSVTTIHTLELLDWKGFAAFVLLMSCNAVNHGPGLRNFCDLEHPLAGR